MGFVQSQAWIRPIVTLLASICKIYAVQLKVFGAEGGIVGQQFYLAATITYGEMQPV